MAVDAYVQKKLKQLRLAHNYTLEALAEQVGTSPITLSRYETGKRAVNLTMLGTICNIYNISLATFFATGHEPKTNVNKKSSTSRATPAQVQIYGEIAAGAFSNAVESILDEIEVPQVLIERFGQANLFGLAIKGESMNKIVQHNDYVILNKQQTANNGDIVAVLLNNEEATLKRFFQLDRETIVLKPESNDPTYQPMTLDLRQPDLTLQIIGKVIWHCAPYYSF